LETAGLYRKYPNEGLSNGIGFMWQLCSYRRRSEWCSVFWDHELPDKLTKLAGSFAAFLELLEPFDPDSIQLKHGQVERVWIDPEFLKKLGKD